MNNKSIPTCKSCTNECADAGIVCNKTCWRHPQITKNTDEKKNIQIKGIIFMV
jgi:hypothetical protein